MLGILILHLKMEKKSCFLTFLLLLLQTAASATEDNCDRIGESSNLKKAYIALQAWKSVITEDPKGYLDNWVGPNVCAYKGIFCAYSEDEFGNSSEPVVAGIDLNHANLKGSLDVEEFSLLTDLALIHLNSNRFTGSLPFALQQLSSLAELDLSNNQLSDTFPYPILVIPNLMYLDLRYNNFYDSIPKELFNKKLDAIFLNNNNFSGPLPSNFGKSPASVMNFAGNKLTGNIPIGYMSDRLREILFLDNQFSGCISEAVGLWQYLKVLDVSSNSLVGQLPDSLSCLKDIEVLNLGQNKLSGVLPDSVCSLRSLGNLTVAGNFFSEVGHQCTKLSFRGVDNDLSLNCIPEMERQRPKQDCLNIPARNLKCPRIFQDPLC